VTVWMPSPVCCADIERDLPKIRNGSSVFAHQTMVGDSGQRAVR
jgi:hypothetical protein